ncbi:MAG: caspase family protein, partial [Acidobacteria bacterium]|nr:caspase family protein [Acidobacteriota bacterium]
MSEFQADPKHTLAIVVGVEKYAVGAEWDLNGPANDAVRFIRWLRGQQVPADQIFTFVSPHNSNRSLLQGLDVNVEPAEHGRITDAITNRLANVSGNLLCFFWGGHGVIDALGNRRLYCADATGANPRHISLNSLLACWRTNVIGRFPHQIGFVDACANYLEFFRTIASMPEDALPMGTPDTGVEQFFLLAASAGEVAKNLALEKAGAFSLALFDQLEKPGRTFPPPMQEINQSMIDHFASLRDEGKAG